MPYTRPEPRRRPQRYPVASGGRSGRRGTGPAPTLPDQSGGCGGAPSNRRPRTKPAVHARARARARISWRSTGRRRSSGPAGAAWLTRACRAPGRPAAAVGGFVHRPEVHRAAAALHVTDEPRCGDPAAVPRLGHLDDVRAQRAEARAVQPVERVEAAAVLDGRTERALPLVEQRAVAVIRT